MCLVYVEEDVPVDTKNLMKKSWRTCRYLIITTTSFNLIIYSRLPMEKELAMVVPKDVMKTRFYEFTLLIVYKF
ncbi:hypothetical protein Hdeb2414_s0018g00525301 [Helianthus debilis subsp. tardiflorus]